MPLAPAVHFALEAARPRSASKRRSAPSFGARRIPVASRKPARADEEDVRMSQHMCFSVISAHRSQTSHQHHFKTSSKINSKRAPSGAFWAFRGLPGLSAYGEGLPRASRRALGGLRGGSEAEKGCSGESGASKKVFREGSYSVLADLKTRFQRK